MDGKAGSGDELDGEIAEVIDYEVSGQAARDAVDVDIVDGRQNAIEWFWGPQDLLASLTRREEGRLFAGGAISRGSRLYMVCRNCLRIVRTNGFFGGMHYCRRPPEED